MSMNIMVVDPTTGEDIDGIELTSNEWREFQQFVAARCSFDAPLLRGFEAWEGSWDNSVLTPLEVELLAIIEELSRTPTTWRERRTANRRSLAATGDRRNPASALDYLVDHDQEPMPTALLRLVQAAIAHDTHIICN